MSSTDNHHDSSPKETPGGGDDSIPVLAEKARKARKATGDPYSISNRVYRALPDTIGDIAREVEEGHERDAFLTGLLPVLAGGLPAGKFKYGGHWLSLNLYTAVIAPAGSGKGKMQHARTVGTPLNKYLHEQSRQERENWLQRQENDEEQAGPEPPFRRLFMAADASAAAMKESLSECPHGVIFETEFKTLSNALSQEWGRFRDVLLKGFQNEPVEVDRKADEPILIDHPAPSMAVSGTPGTFSEVIGDTEDGLFSRFAFYQFDGEPTWKSQFGDTSQSCLENALSRASDRLKRMYQEQQGRDRDLYITFSEDVEQTIDNVHHFLTNRWREEDIDRALHSSVKRTAVRSLRIASIICLIRRHEEASTVFNAETVEVGMEDAEIGLRLALTYLAHSLRIAEQIPWRKAKTSLNQKQQAFLKELPTGEFPSSEIEEAAERVGRSARTARNWVQKAFVDRELVRDVEHGTWEKLTPRPGSAEKSARCLSCLSCLFSLLDDDPSLLLKPLVPLKTENFSSGRNNGSANGESS